MAVYRHMNNYTLSDACAEHNWGSNNRWFRIVPIDHFFKRAMHIFYANFVWCCIICLFEMNQTIKQSKNILYKYIQAII